jgi:hypothetical protein
MAQSLPSFLDHIRMVGSWSTWNLRQCR